MSVSKPTTLTRYCLFQIPGVVIAAALAWAAAHWFSVPIWAGILAVAIWIAKDVALYPILSACDKIPDFLRKCLEHPIHGQNMGPDYSRFCEI